MSFATYYMHLIFGRIPSLMSSDLILYVLPALTISILFFSIKIMFFKTPKLRNYCFLVRKNIKSATYMCRNIPYWRFNFCSDIFIFKQKI